MPLDIKRLADVIRHITVSNAKVIDDIESSFLDTLAVAVAGREEPVVTKLQAIYGLVPSLPEHRALVGATSAHALDYDDVQLQSSAHVSAVIVPALLAAQWPHAGADMAAGYMAGLFAARMLGQALGPQHYALGWHASSTIGPAAAAAAVCRMWGASDAAIQAALALAVCQAAGMQKSFGSMAKPLQAGMASSAGVRAAYWARQGITGPTQPFGEKGFETLYSDGPTSELDWSNPLTVDVARKAYPCCYGAYRMIAAALAIREQLCELPVHDLVVDVPSGTLLPLKFENPSNGNEAKFCATYLVAAALLDGAVTLAHFEDGMLERADIQTMRERIRVREVGPVGGALEGGQVTALAYGAAGELLADTVVTAFPGSPQAPLSREQLDAKLSDCLRAVPITLPQFRSAVTGKLHGTLGADEDVLSLRIPGLTLHPQPLY